MTKRIKLDLSVDEATVLATILLNIGGDPAGPRGLADAVRKQLTDQGFPGNTHFVENEDVIRGDIRLPNTIGEIHALPTFEDFDLNIRVVD